MSILLTALAILQTATPPVGQRTIPAERLISGASLVPDEEQDPLVAAAAAFPLGSSENPVRVGGPEGEIAYLQRLRCSDGATPRIGARSQGGPGAFGSLVASYPLSCAGAAPVTLVMDMYHAEHREESAPPGFTLPAR
jgi:hypothetical protein